MQREGFDMDPIRVDCNRIDRNVTVCYGTKQDILVRNCMEQARTQWGGQDTKGYYGNRRKKRLGSIKQNNFLMWNDGMRRDGAGLNGTKQ